MYIAYYKQRVTKNVMPTQIVPTIEIYQSDFPNLIILKRPANVAISSFLLLSFCSLYKAHYQQRVGEKQWLSIVFEVSIKVITETFSK